MTLLLVAMKAMLVRPGGKIENPERFAPRHPKPRFDCHGKHARLALWVAPPTVRPHPKRKFNLSLGSFAILSGLFSFPAVAQMLGGCRAISSSWSTQIG